MCVAALFELRRGGLIHGKAFGDFFLREKTRLTQLLKRTRRPFVPHTSGGQASNPWSVH
jgi:hypothetical protein